MDLFDLRISMVRNLSAPILFRVYTLCLIKNTLSATYQTVLDIITGSTIHLFEVYDMYSYQLWYHITKGKYGYASAYIV